MQTAARLALPIWAAAMLAGCGGSPKQADGALPGAAPASAIATDKNKPASAEEVAKQARHGLHCPARITLPERSGDAPVDDIQGVRPGLSYDEAWNAVLCTNDLLVATPENDGFDIKTYGHKVRQGFSARFAQPREVKTSRQIIQEMEADATARGTNAVRHDMTPGQVRWAVGTMGLPGQERVLSVSRKEEFAKGKNPAMSTLKDALTSKYGTPTYMNNDGDGTMHLAWLHDPQGKAVVPNSPLESRCNSSIAAMDYKHQRLTGLRH